MTFTPEQLDHIHKVMEVSGKSFNDVVVALIKLGMDIEKAMILDWQQRLIGEEE